MRSQSSSALAIFNPIYTFTEVKRVQYIQLGRMVEDASTRKPNLSSNFEISFSFTARNISQGYFHFVPLISIKII
jgi:hypothetical protein